MSSYFISPTTAYFSLQCLHVWSQFDLYPEWPIPKEHACPANGKWGATVWCWISCWAASRGYTVGKQAWQELDCWGLVSELWLCIGCRDLLHTAWNGTENNNFIKNKQDYHPVSILAGCFFWADGLWTTPLDQNFPPLSLTQLWYSLVHFWITLQDLGDTMVILLTNNSSDHFYCFPIVFKRKGEWKQHMKKLWDKPDWFMTWANCSLLKFLFKYY